MTPEKPTRTEQGYANWKQMPTRVRDARIQAEGLIAARHLYRALVESWAVPVVDWLAKRLGGTR